MAGSSPLIHSAQMSALRTLLAFAMVSPIAALHKIVHEQSSARDHVQLGDNNSLISEKWSFFARLRNETRSRLDEITSSVFSARAGLVPPRSTMQDNPQNPCPFSAPQ
jgi:hypothetical protein